MDTLDVDVGGFVGQHYRQQSVVAVMQSPILKLNRWIRRPCARINPPSQQSGLVQVDLVLLACP